MATRPDGDKPTWLIFAIPATALLVPLGVALLIVAVRPAQEKPEKPNRSVAITTPEPSPPASESRPPPTPIDQPSPAPSASPQPGQTVPTPAPAVVESAPAGSTPIAS